MNNSSRKAYKLLQEFEERSPDILMRLFDLQIYGEMEKIEHHQYFSEATVEETDEHIHELVEFGYEGGAWYFWLWYYPGIVKEPPVISWDNGELDLLAPTLSDYVLILPHITSEADKVPMPLHEKLSLLKEKLELVDIDDFEQQIKNDSQTVFEIEDKDPFWTDCWSLYDLYELHEDYKEIQNESLSFKDTILSVHDYLTKFNKNAEKHFSLSDNSIYFEERRRFEVMKKAIAPSFLV